MRWMAAVLSTSLEASRRRSIDVETRGTDVETRGTDVEMEAAVQSGSPHGTPTTSTSAEASQSRKRVVLREGSWLHRDRSRSRDISSIQVELEKTSQSAPS